MKTNSIYKKKIRTTKIPYINPNTKNEWRQFNLAFRKKNI